MSTFLIFGNIHLGLEFAGAIVFFIVAWLFGGAYLSKKDAWSAGRSSGFLLLSFWQILHAAYGFDGEFFTSASYIYLAGLLLVLLSYALENLPPRPTGILAVFPVLPYFFVSSKFGAIISILILAVVVALTKRYFKDIDKLLKWMLVGFALLATASLIPVFGGDEAFGTMWFLEHVVKLAAFAAFGVWIWQWLSLRLREEILIVFISASLIIALLMTTAFSMLSVQRIETETKNSLIASAKIFNFYMENLKSRAMVSVELIASNGDFTSAFKAGDLADLGRISKELLASTGEQFISVSRKNGDVLFKLNAPAAVSENILSEQIGSEAIEGRPAVTIDRSGGGELEVRAAAPLFDKGALVGAVIVGIRLDESFVNGFKEISKLEATILTDNRVAASTIFQAGETVNGLPLAVSTGQEFVGSARFFDKEIIGDFVQLKNIGNQSVAILAITTTPGQILSDSQSTNRLTLLIVLIVVLILVLPLYRLTVFLAQ